MAASIVHRRRDLVYLIFFLTHIPVMFAVDLYPLYPAQVRPTWMTDLRRWYVTTYRDQFFVLPPAWFTTYMWLELLYHVPLSVWAVGALLRDDPKIALHLLVYACQTAITTLTCIADYMSWSNFGNVEKLKLGQLYVPYLALSVFMLVDMFGRLNTMLSFKSSPSKKWQ